MKNKIEAIQLTISLLREQQAILVKRNENSVKSLWAGDIAELEVKINDLLREAVKVCLNKE